MNCNLAAAQSLIDAKPDTPLRMDVCIQCALKIDLAREPVLNKAKHRSKV